MGCGSCTGTRHTDASDRPAGCADGRIGVAVHPRPDFTLPRNRQPALVDHKASPLAHYASLSTNWSTACSPLVVASPTHPADGDLRTATQRDSYSPVGVFVSVLYGTARFCPEYSTGYPSSQSAVSRSVEYLGSLFTFCSVQYRSRGRTVISWVIIAAHGGCLWQRGLGDEWALVWS